MFFKLRRDRGIMWGCTLDDRGTVETYPIALWDKSFNFVELHRFFLTLLGEVEEGRSPISVDSLLEIMPIIDFYISDKPDKFNVFMNHVDLAFWWKVRMGGELFFRNQASEVSQTSMVEDIKAIEKLFDLCLASQLAGYKIPDWEKWIKKTDLYAMSPCTIGTIITSIDKAAMTDDTFDPTRWRQLGPYVDWLRADYAQELTAYIQNNRKLWPGVKVHGVHLYV